MVHVREPLEDSTIEGVYIAGASGGSYEISKDSDYLDLVSIFFKIVLKIDHPDSWALHCRLDYWAGDWKEGDWIRLASW